MTKIVHFEITGEDPARLAQFYAGVFGWQAQASPFAPDYHLLSGPEGQVGATMSRTVKSQPSILWFEVDDLDASLSAIIAGGGAAAGERATIPGEGQVQYVADPSGTILGLKQPG